MPANKSSRRASEPPHKVSSATTRPSSVSKAAGADVDSTAAINQQRKNSSYKSQKENDHQHSSNSVLEKRRPSQFTHLESQLGEVQEELNRTKDQLASSESCRKGAQQEAEEAKMQLIIMSSKFEDSQRQLMELSAAEDDRIHELRKISQERDKAWQSELAALQNQQSIDMAAWSSAIKERQKLRSEIEMFVRSEAAMAKQLEASNSELQVVKEEILDKNSIIERLKIQIAEREGAENMANGSSNETQLQLVKFKARVHELEDMVKKLQALSANELVDNLKTVPGQAESKLESELKEAKAEIANLKSKLVNKDADLRNISHMNKKLNDEIRAQVNQVEAEFSSKITQAAMDISELKVMLAEKDIEVQKLSEENNLMKIEMGKKEMEGTQSCEVEMEAELRRVKLHSNQWRKAAETAAAILMAGSNGRVIERTGSLDPQYFYDGKNLVHSPNFGEIGGDPPRSKNHNVLTMIGGLWKKS